MEKSQENGPAGRKKDKTERLTELSGRTTEETVKRNQITALRFQTGGRHQTSQASLPGYQQGHELFALKELKKKKEAMRKEQDYNEENKDYDQKRERERETKKKKKVTFFSMLQFGEGGQNTYLHVS